MVELAISQVNTHMAPATLPTAPGTEDDDKVSGAEKPEASKDDELHEVVITRGDVDALHRIVEALNKDGTVAEEKKGAKPKKKDKLGKSRDRSRGGSRSRRRRTASSDDKSPSEPAAPEVLQDDGYAFEPLEEDPGTFDEDLLDSDLTFGQQLRDAFPM